MLLELFIKNFVLIEEQRLYFSSGLNVLTGETGAGKSIIMDALGLLLGDRSKNDYVRDESQKAIVEAVFALQPDSGAFLFLAQMELLEAGSREVVVSREIHGNGRNTARLNGRNVLSVPALFGSKLVDLQSQDEHMIFTGRQNLDYIDSYADDTQVLRKAVAVPMPA
jgi:DNA repair protein RecN (Recombination protein N)